MNTKLILDFKQSAKSSEWTITDDIVMGGKSNSQFYVSPAKHGVFQGKVSLENNGGFSSVRYREQKFIIKKHKNIIIHLCGDGKKYQFRVKSKIEDQHSYIFYFETSGEWEEIIIPLKELVPRFRGKTLDMPNFSGNAIEEIGFIIGNEREEDFKLYIDSIELK